MRPHACTEGAGGAKRGRACLCCAWSARRLGKLEEPSQGNGSRFSDRAVPLIHEWPLASLMMTCSRLDDDDDKSKAPLPSACAPRICYPASFLRLHRLQAPIRYLTRVICSISRLLSSPALPRSFTTNRKIPTIISAFRTCSAPDSPIVLSFSSQPRRPLELHALHHLYTAASTPHRPAQTNL